MAKIIDPNRVRFCEYLVLRNQLHIVALIELEVGATIMVRGSLPDAEGKDHEFTTTSLDAITRAKRYLAKSVSDVPA